jgi:hypothetical protein
MGLFKLIFGRFKNRRDRNEKETLKSAGKEARQTIRLNTNSERLTYIRDNCEQMMECLRQVEESKMEYQAVTSYLTDMQKIDMVPLEQRGNMEEAARNIYNLTKERNKLKNKSSILTDSQYRLLEQYEPVIPKDMAQIKNSEDYQGKIQQDIINLEKERRNLDIEQDEIISKQAFLKGLAITISVVVIILFLLFITLSSVTKSNYTIPFLMTVLMGMISALFIFMEARKNVAGIKLVQSKQNRQITLMNKVKIKSVNNRNYLDYTYSKYNIENSDQLKLFWEEYIRVKEENRKYQNNTQLLEFNNNELIKELKKFGIADTEIWIFQPLAILDNKEMVEVRHRLNIRRQKLRERMDLNIKQKEEAFDEVKTLMDKYPDISSEGEKLLRKYRLQTE